MHMHPVLRLFETTSVVFTVICVNAGFTYHILSIMDVPDSGQPVIALRVSTGTGRY